MKYNFQTIDLDRRRDLVPCLKWLAKCPITSLTVTPSPSGRGWHITIFCRRLNCIKCRRRWDDPVRFLADITNRQPHQRNVLFSRKIRVYPQKGVIKINKKEKPAT